MTDVLYALSLLTPWDIDKPKVRIGPATDGGYIFVNDMSPEQSVISYGIHTEYRFDEEMAARGHDVFMFDHTIDGIRQTNERMHFIKEGVAGRNDPAASLFTIEDQLERHAIRGNRLILKMDVEGAEYASLLGIDDRVLQRFEQMTLEFHDMHLLWDGVFRQTFVDTFRKINRHFTLFHVHANNYDGPDTFHFVDNLPVVNLMELSYVKTSSIRRRRSTTLYPTYLDYPNTLKADKRLWFYPFMPTDRCYEDFAASWDRTRLQTGGRHA